MPSPADIRAWCAICGVPDRAADLTATLHSRSKDDGKFILRVVVHADYIWIECEDAGGPWHIPDNDGRPHGLDVVHALCGEGGWGVEVLDGGRAGRVVWARLELDRIGS